ncbi:hypothetical protein BLNAU_21902 [Blattamonas nauphoetae]|uniref:Uncharacterized protein n=1 Tax=Blattamonas nauphoetae TaxID=2049346 RepID=A0ABQ9WUL2_9EUKA|nr:hypothetical protein BLNAU_21902 [Blattamonas nauphoetae]
MVRDDYQFDEELLQKSSTFFSSMTSLFKTNDLFDGFLRAIGQASPNPAAVILSSPRLRDLSVIDDKVIMNDIIDVFRSSVRISSSDGVQALSIASDTDPESIRHLVLHEVLIPIEPSLVQMGRNPHILSLNNQCREVLRLPMRIFEVSVFHQPTLYFICSSRIPILFQSLLSKEEDEYTHQLIIWLLYHNIGTWKEDGAETADRGRILLQTLEMEGFLDGLEQTLFHDESTQNGRFVRSYSFLLVIDLGMNSSEPE